MNIIAYECLRGFHRRFTKADNKPELQKLSAFTNLMQDDYSGENLFSKIISTEEHWEKMLETKGFGKGVKYSKAQDYRRELITAWDFITEIFDTKNEVEISKLMGKFLWDMKDNEFINSYLGVIEEAIRQNKLWKNPIIKDIFISIFISGFNEFKSIDDIALKHNVDRERVRQLREESLNQFDQDFWFLRDILINEKVKFLFNFKQNKINDINELTDIVNKSEKVHFTMNFYTKVLSIIYDFELIGNINDLMIQNKGSSKRNIWNNLYLQTKLENERCNLNNLIDHLSIEIYNNNSYFENDKVIEISQFVTTLLTEDEINRYNSVIKNELIGVDIVLKQNKVIIKRNSFVTQPEIVEEALRELGGLAYANDILEKVKIISPERNWTMPILRASFRGENFYSVGKSALFGLKNIKDVRHDIGNGTINQIVQKYLSRKDSPIHIYELFEHVNNLFPRPKTINSIHTIIEQNSKGYFKKFDGGFYGLSSKDYENIKFPKIVGGHGASLRQIIDKSNGLSFEDVFEIINQKFGLLEIQIKYLLNNMIENRRLSNIGEKYHHYISPEADEINENENYKTLYNEIDTEIDQVELDFEELNLPDVSDELMSDAIAQIKIRRGQPKFRQKLLSFYCKTCIITGCKIIELLEAAHIMPHSRKQDFSLSNGLLLRADIHTLFDLGLIAIEPESKRLKLNKSLMETIEYANLDDIDIGARLNKLNQSYKLNLEGLYWRWNIFIESE